MTDDKFELDYHKMMAMLTYILAEPMRVSHDYAAFESLFVLVFEGVQEKISNENLLTLLDSLKTMIYVI